MLLNAVILGNEAAFEELYALTRSGVYRKLFRVLRDQFDSEEVLQEVYATIWLKSKQFKPCRGNVAGWINAIARNLALDLIRLRKRQSLPAFKLFHETGGSDCEIVCLGLQPLNNMIANERLNAVRACLKSLPLGPQECVALAFFEGLSHSQIANRVGIPLGTVKTWISRSYDHLRPMLGAHR
jgi:RNA polymerase sigma-70 factor, ECF subfamily